MAIGTDREFLSADEIERIALTMPYSDYVPGKCHCVNVHLEDDYAIIELVMKSSGGTYRVKQQHTFHYVNCPRLTAGNGDAEAELRRRGLPAISGGASTETVVAAYLDGDQAAAAELRRRSIEAKRSQTVVERETGESKSARIAKRSARRSRNRSSRRGSKQRLRYLSDAQIDWSNS